MVVFSMGLKIAPPSTTGIFIVTAVALVSIKK